MMRPVPSLLAAALANAAIGCADVDEAPSQQASELTSLRAFGSNPGNLLAYKHVPAGVGARPPLVVVLHGCTQTAADYTAAGWNELADRWGFVVLYPEQQTGNNRNRCFNWFEAGDIARGQGEALSIRQMVDAMRAAHDVDPARVYVTGLSAGGAMTSVMLAAYPDVFAAGAVMAGLPYRCATSVGEAFMCMNPGVDRAPADHAARVRGELRDFAGPYPRVSIWAGTRDTTVSPSNVTEIAQQWTALHGLDDRADATGTVEGAAHAEHRRADGATAVETWLVPNMTHGTAIRPGDERAAGCGRPGAYVLSAGICSTYHAARFFGLEPAAAADAGGPDASTPDAATPDASTPDAATPDVMGPDAATPDAATPDVATACREYDDTNWNHVLAGRATRCGVGGSYVCAAGSGAQFGLWTLVRSWLREPRAGYFEPGRCAAR
jgi:poly(hydroxyalkanoate) depolymerase family esterase